MTANKASASVAENKNSILFGHQCSCIEYRENKDQLKTQICGSQNVHLRSSCYLKRKVQEETVEYSN